MYFFWFKDIFAGVFIYDRFTNILFGIKTDLVTLLKSSYPYTSSGGHQVLLHCRTVDIIHLLRETLMRLL